MASRKVTSFLPLCDSIGSANGRSHPASQRSGNRDNRVAEFILRAASNGLARGEKTRSVRNHRPGKLVLVVSAPLNYGIKHLPIAPQRGICTLRYAGGFEGSAPKPTPLSDHIPLGGVVRS